MPTRYVEERPRPVTKVPSAQPPKKLPLQRQK
jgi:hypothetical protein